MAESNGITVLLQRAKSDDKKALEELLVRLAPEVDGWIRNERGRAIEAKFETIDLRQDFFVVFLNYLPNMSAKNEDTLRKLLYRMIQNMMRDRGKFLNRELRRFSREKPLPSDTILELDPPDALARKDRSPSSIIDENQEQAIMRVALALLEPEERELVVRHHIERESYVDIGADLGLEPDTVRMRCNRATANAVKLVGRVKRGEIARILDEPPTPERAAH